MENDDKVIKVDAYLGNDGAEGDPVYSTLYVSLSEIYLVMDYDSRVIAPNNTIPEGCTAIIHLHTEFAKGMRTLYVTGQSASDIIELARN